MDSLRKVLHAFLLILKNLTCFNLTLSAGLCVSNNIACKIFKEAIQVLRNSMGFVSSYQTFHIEAK